MRKRHLCYGIFLSVLALMFLLCSCVSIRGSADGPASKPSKCFTPAEKARIWKKLDRCAKFPAKCKLRIKAEVKICQINCDKNLIQEKNKHNQTKQELARTKISLDLERKAKTPIHWAWIAVPAYVGGVVTAVVIYAVIDALFVDRSR